MFVRDVCLSAKTVGQRAWMQPSSEWMDPPMARDFFRSHFATLALLAGSVTLSACTQVDLSVRVPRVQRHQFANSGRRFAQPDATSNTPTVVNNVKPRDVPPGRNQNANTLTNEIAVAEEPTVVAPESAIQLAAHADQPGQISDNLVPVPAVIAAFDADQQKIGDDAQSGTVPLATESRVMGLAELEELALANNPTLEQSRARIMAANGTHTQVGLYPNPVLMYQGSEIGNDGRGGQQGVGVSQEFVTAGKLDLNRNAASHDVQRRQYELSTQEYRVLTSVRQGFYEVLVAQRSVELAEQLVRISQDSQKAAQALFDAQQGNRIDLLQARVEANEARVLLNNARNRHRAAWTQLATNMGVPDMPAAQMAGDLDPELVTLDPQILREQILQNSPELAAAQATVNRTRVAIDRAKVEPIPNIETQASIQYDYGSQFTIAGAQVGVSLPIFNRNQGNIQKAEAEYIAAYREIERVKLEIENRLAATLERYANANYQVERFSKQILPDANESLQLVTAGYRQGELDYLRLLTTQRTNFQTNLQYLEALRAWWAAKLELDGLLLTGGLNAPTT